MLQLVPPPPPADKPTLMLDVECYRNYFLVKLYDIATGKFYDFEMYDGCVFRWDQLRVLLAGSLIVTFNGNKYDMLMVSAAAVGFTCDMLKGLTDYIICTKPSPQPWMVAQQYGFEILQLDHIDLIEVAPGQGSLKIYGGRLHCKKLQDLPIKPEAILTRDEMVRINVYCGNDLTTTASLYFALKDDIDTREELTAQYGVDMRSKSDAQIAEAAFKKLIGRKVYPPQVPPGTQFQWTPAPFLRFQTPLMQDAFERAKRAVFVIEPSGSPKMPPELDGFQIAMGGAILRLGIGGLHSTEKSCRHITDGTFSLVDVDVVSYYPKIISILRMFPHQIGEVFLTIYDGWIEVRIEYKNKKNKKKAATYKIKINGTFGKTGSKYSILYAPKMMIDTTVNGQFSLLMLIERATLAGLTIVQANTDGVVFKTPTGMDHVRDAVVAQWELDTGFETEANAYRALFSRDVNSYLAFKPDGEVKTKGEYANDPSSRLSKNPANTICLDAMIAYIRDGVPLEKTIRGCADIRKFVTVRNVQGGGDWVSETIVSDTVAQTRAALMAAGWTEIEKNKWTHPECNLSSVGTESFSLTKSALEILRKGGHRQYLGKTVRWYYGAGQRGHIAYCGNGNLVPKSQGAKPCMELPEVLPPDIDYDWYVREAQSMLKDVDIHTGRG